MGTDEFSLSFQKYLPYIRDTVLLTICIPEQIVRNIQCFTLGVRDNENERWFAVRCVPPEKEIEQIRVLTSIILLE